MGFGRREKPALIRRRNAEVLLSLVNRPLVAEHHMRSLAGSTNTLLRRNLAGRSVRWRMLATSSSRGASSSTHSPPSAHSASGSSADFEPVPP